jgi:mannitol-1-phosphate 5-dehydrogenase
MEHCFFGFGFGPIQSGLFLYEAFRSGHFSELGAAEIDGSVVDAVRANGDRYVVNVAHETGIEKVTVGPVALLDPKRDRDAVVMAVARATEVSTALPSVRAYTKGVPSVAALLADGLARRTGDRTTLVYAAENHNHAAELLEEAVAAQPFPRAANVQYLNTVIGKMSGTIDDPQTVERLGLAPVAPGVGRAVLVESFRRILVSGAPLGVPRGIDVFEEKPDLLPFEEAKLYGHNAIHSMIAYLASLRGYETIADAGRDPELMRMARSAFLEESGKTLVKRHGHLGERLFTEEGYRAYADDLLARMVNPLLYDQVARVARDPLRKLAYQDRLCGTIRLALEYGVLPRYLAVGAAAALLYARRSGADAEAGDPVTALERLWGDTADARARAVATYIARALPEAQAFARRHT